MNLDVLAELSKGGRLMRKSPSCSLKWESGKGPSLANDITSALFRAGLITPEYKPGMPHTLENATGYIILTEAGKLKAPKVEQKRKIRWRD